MGWQVFARRPDGTLEGEFTTYTNLTIVKRLRQVGNWSMTLPSLSDLALAISQDGWGIEVWRDGEWFFGGPRRHRGREASQTSNVLTPAGRDDLFWLGGRRAYQVPSAINGTALNASAHDDLVDLASTVILHFVDVNAGPGATPERRVPRLVMGPDLGLGPTVHAHARLHNLLEFIQFFAIAGGLGFRIVKTPSAPVEAPTMTFEVYEPRDLRNDVRFAFELGNLDSYTYEHDDADFNVAIVGGGGEGTSREFVIVWHGLSMATTGRYETFLDQRNTTDDQELAEAGFEALAEHEAKLAITAKVRDTDSLAFGRDYDLGDLVSVVIDGEPLAQYVTEVQVTLSDRGGMTVVPTIGGSELRALAADRMTRALLERLRQAEARLSALERR